MTVCLLSVTRSKGDLRWEKVTMQFTPNRQWSDLPIKYRSQKKNKKEKEAEGDKAENSEVVKRREHLRDQAHKEGSQCLSCLFVSLQILILCYSMADREAHYWSQWENPEQQSRKRRRASGQPSSSRQGPRLCTSLNPSRWLQGSPVRQLDGRPLLASPPSIFGTFAPTDCVF